MAMLRWSNLKKRKEDMAINTRDFQTVVLPKIQLAKVKKLAKETRYPMTRIIGHAVNLLLENEEAKQRLREGKIHG